MSSDRRPRIKRSPLEADRAFRDRVAELGGVVLEPNWLGANAPHRIRCAAGHENSPRPGGVLDGRGICVTCARKDPRAAERAFRELVEKLGGVVLESKWLGNSTPHRIRCPKGHESSPRPDNLKSRGTFCRTCAERDPLASEAQFRARVAELGGTVLEPKWLGTSRPHRVLCAAGHECRPRPAHLNQGRGLCITCAKRDAVQAEREFRARVAALGGTVLEPVYLGANAPHRVRCSQGHEAAPRPTHLQSGEGLCRRCAGKAWDAFYVVANSDTGVIKFGITSGDPRPRLKRHAKRGFESVLRVLTDLPGSVAPELERSVIATLRLAGEEPVRGREYYDERVTPIVLDTVDHYPLRPLDLSSTPAQMELPFPPECERAGEIDLIIAKNRMGTTGTVTLGFQGRKARVVEFPR